MRCPWCEHTGDPRPLHAHLSSSHPEQVSFVERGGRTRYEIVCPICSEGYDQVIKPRLDDPSFVEEYRQEIRLVAFDMLVSHLIGAHPEGADNEVPETRGAGDADG